AVFRGDLHCGKLPTEGTRVEKPRDVSDEPRVAQSRAAPSPDMLACNGGRAVGRRNEPPLASATGPATGRGTDRTHRPDSCACLRSRAGPGHRSARARPFTPKPCDP